MDIKHLVENYPKLQQYISEIHYSDMYIKQINQAFSFIVQNNKDYWNDYFDVEKEFCNSKKENTNNSRRVALSVIANFDCFEIYPNGSRQNYFKINLPLIQPFQEFLEYVEKMAEKNGLADSYNMNCISILKSFMVYLQDKGIKSFQEVHPEDVISFFSNGKEPMKSYDSVMRLRHALEKGMNWNEAIRKIYIDIPIIRNRRKNIQYLTPEEIAALLEALEDETTGLSLCARTIGYLLYYTGLRACDITRMKIGNIDWDKEKIMLVQHKTGIPVTLPLPVKAGNMIFRYLTEERPECDCDFLFIRSNAPYKPYNPTSITNICSKIFKTTGIRQNPGERQGSHIFRHNVVKKLLENGVSKPVITAMIGHSNPSSIDAYVNTDFIHLKECALSVERFPMGPEAFRYE